jgi:dipeptidyl aminopeptidase/acylaminoacyl peptidase
MKKTRKSNGTLETLLVIGLILIIPLFFVIRTAAEQNAALNTPAPSLPTAANAPALPTAANTEEDSAMKPKQPPACTFPLAETTMEDSTPENYTFSGPQVIYTPNPDDSNVEIVEWLPDNRQVLIVQNIKGVPQQRIELFDSETRERKVYATREQTEHPPSWNQESGAVVYPVKHILAFKNNIPEITRQLWVSYGNPDAAQMLANNLPQFAVAVKPGNGQTVYFSNKQISKKNEVMQNMASAPFDLEQWNYRNMKSGIFPLMYDMTWRPDSSQVFLYTFADREPGYTYLLDVDSGEICELNLGGWAVTARWSPNGRYLAIVRSQSPDRPVNPTVLTVLDTVTGNIYTLKSISQELDKEREIGGLAWAPGNRHLIVLGVLLPSRLCASDCYPDVRLYLVDFLSGQVNAVLPDSKFVINDIGANLAWSPDGSKIAALCWPGLLCNASVQINGQ